MGASQPQLPLRPSKLPFWAASGAPWGPHSPSFAAVIVSYSTLRHCTDGVLDLLNAKFETHIIRGPQKVNERGSEVAEMSGPEGQRGAQRCPELGPQWQLEGHGWLKKSQGPSQRFRQGIAERNHRQSQWISAQNGKPGIMRMTVLSSIFI